MKQYLKEKVTFEDLSNELSSISSSWHPSEIHGVLSGILLAQPNFSREQFYEKLNRMFRKSLECDVQGSLISNLFEETFDQLKTDNFSLDLLLPNNRETISNRVQAELFWCQGFVLGFQNPEESMGIDPILDIVNDLQDIMQFNVENKESKDLNDKLFEELSQFIKLAISNIHEYIKTTGLGG